MTRQEAIDKLMKAHRCGDFWAAEQLTTLETLGLIELEEEKPKPKPKPLAWDDILDVPDHRWPDITVKVQVHRLRMVLEDLGYRITPIPTVSVVEGDSQ